MSCAPSPRRASGRGCARCLGCVPKTTRWPKASTRSCLTATLPQALKDELELIGDAYGDYLRSLRLAAAGTSGHGRQILSRFPAFMRADRRGKALGELAHALGRDLDEADRLILEIRDAHAITAAKEETDVLRLASALGFERADFLVLAKLKDKGFYATDDLPGADAFDRADIAYRQYLTDLKEAVGRFARICLRGCGTVPALLAGAMVLLNGDPRNPAGGAEREDPEKDPRYPDNIVVHPDLDVAARWLYPWPADYVQRDRGDGR